jgi:GAF domain-containing protein
MVQMMHIQKASLFFLNEEKVGFHLVESIDLEIRTNLPSLLVKEDPLLQDLLKRGEILLRDELAMGNPIPESSEIIERMTLLGAAISIPLTSKGKLVGLINLSKRHLSEAYSPEDVELLSTLAYQSAVALENRRLSEPQEVEIPYRESRSVGFFGTLTAARP